MNIMRSLHWFNPLAWWALRQVRLKQEQACDDCVLNQGVNPADYATDLLSITANLADFKWDSAVALAMNRTTRLERRLESILDQNQNRNPLTKWRTVLALVAIIGIFVGIAGTRRGVVEAAPTGEPQALVQSDGEEQKEKEKEKQQHEAEKITTTTPQ